MKVAVIEDDNFSYEILEDCLGREGVTDIIRAHNFDEAIDIVQRMEEQFLWIIDGQFPLNASSHATKDIGPVLVSLVRIVRAQLSEIIFWYSASPELFIPITDSLTRIYWKQDFFALAKEVAIHKKAG